jgi:hypothetical protein
LPDVVVVNANPVEFEAQQPAMLDGFLGGLDDVRPTIGDDDDDLPGLLQRIGLLQHPPD